MHFDRPVDGSGATGSSKGSRWAGLRCIRLEIDVENGKIAGARIGGHAVKVAEGVLFA